MARLPMPNSCMLEPLVVGLDKILPCFLARLHLDQIFPGTLEELGVNLGKILANQNLTRQSWLFIQDTSKILGNVFSREKTSLSSSEASMWYSKSWGSVKLSDIPTQAIHNVIHC